MLSKSRYKVDLQNSLLQLQCEFVAEEGWFGQPKYSTPLKSNLRCTGLPFSELGKFLVQVENKLLLDDWAWIWLGSIYHPLLQGGSPHSSSPDGRNDVWTRESGGNQA